MVVPRCERTGEVVEPMLTDQWFVAMKTPAPATIRSCPGTRSRTCASPRSARESSPRTGAIGKVEFVPGDWTSTYLHWMKNIQDWCITRQLWWGHQIPAWYDESGNVFVGDERSRARSRMRRAQAGRRPH